MGLTEYREKLALAEKSATQAHCVELLQLVRKEKLREPRVVAAFGQALLDKHSWGLGNERTWRPWLGLAWLGLTRSSS
jgi:hypothetical protein